MSFLKFSKEKGFVLIFLSFALLFISPLLSQSEKLLKLKKAELTLKEAKGDYERALKLKEMGLISEEEFSKKETSYLRAQVEYHEAYLSFFGSEAKVVVQSAVKWMDERGRLHVRVSLLYSARELEALFSSGIKEELFPLNLTKEIKDIHVSLLSDGFIVSDPYQRRIESLSIGESKDLDFILLKDVESLYVSIFYLGREERVAVYLLKEGSSNLVTMSSSQFSQEAELGGEAVYQLSLERYTREGSNFRLALYGVPDEISYEFFDPVSQARLSQIRFPEGVTSMKMNLRLFLPKNPSKIQIDKPIKFYALCLGEEEWKKFLSSQNIESIKSGKLSLEIVPKGVGRIEISAENLYHEIKVGENISMEIKIKNSGTRRLDGIKVMVDLPLGWRAEIEPELIETLEQEKERIVKVKFIPPEDVSVGDYEPKIKAESLSGGKRIESDEKVVRVHISSRTNILGITVLILILIGIMVGIVWFGIKLTRR
jgi:hypothetical protein